MIDINELRQSIGAVQPEEVAELLDRLEAAEKERDALRAELLDAKETVRELFHGAGVANMTITTLQARLNGIWAEKELALMAKLEAAEAAWKVSDKSLHDLTEKVIPNLLDQMEAAEKNIVMRERVIDLLGVGLNTIANERDALFAKIAEMEKQKPFAWVRKLGLDLPSVGCVTDLKYRPSDIPESSYIPIYLAPGAQPAPSFADAYQGAMEEVAIWKMRALEAEDLNRKFIAEINGPTYMGEPTSQKENEMTDIVERLNDSLSAGYDNLSAGYSDLRKEAAVEIMRLREGYVRLRDAGDLEMGDGDLARQIASEMLAP